MRPNINVAGYAADVLTYYQAALGGELQITRFAGTLPDEHIPPGWADKVLYGRLHTPFGEVDVMDAPPGRESPVGGNIAIAIDIEDEDRAATAFAKLAAGGNVMMPWEQTFFARKFGMATDKFGVRWMVSVGAVAAIRS